MAQLVQSFVGDTALRLQDEEYVRQMTFGTNWRQIRIAMRVSMPQGTGSLGNAPLLYAGLCQGTANGFKSSSTDEWLGMRVGSGNWNYSGIAPAGYTINGGITRCYKIGSTLTLGSLISVQTAVSTAYTTVWTFDFVRTATGYSLNALIPSSVPAADTTEATFLYNSHTDPTSYGAINYASNYLLDCVSIYFNYPSVGWEINSILVVRFT